MDSINQSVKDYKRKAFIDAVIVLLNISAGRGNYLLFGLLGVDSTNAVMIIVMALDILYLLTNIKYLRIIKLKYSPFALVFLMLFYNMFNVFVHGFGTTIYMLLILMQWSLFYLVLLVQLFYLTSHPFLDHEYGVIHLSRGYIWIAMISILGVVFSFIALRIGLTSSGHPIFADYMTANADRAMSYSWTFTSVNYSASLLESIRMPFFHDYGVLSGLFHESHLLALNTFPCLILLLGITKGRVWKYIVVALAVLIMFFSASTTNIVATFLCLLAFFVTKFKSSTKTVFLVIILVVAAVYWYVVNSDGVFLNFFLDRLDSSNSSHLYSVGLLEWTFSPKTLFGTNFLSTSFLQGVSVSRQDIGFIPFIFTSVFLFIYLRNTAKLIFSLDKVSVAVGFASLYLILHSAKGGLTLFYQTLPELMIMLQLYILNYGTVRNIKTNIPNREETQIRR